VAILSAAGATVAMSRADAALYYCRIPSPGFIGPPPCAARRQKIRQHLGKKDATEKEAASSLRAADHLVSIGQAAVKVYDAHGFSRRPRFPRACGHSTPMGVFSVIRNTSCTIPISTATRRCPIWQRITGLAWPCTQACCPAIRHRMLHPDADGFAVKMWNWTKMGARVVVTPGETTPASFSHPLLPRSRSRRSRRRRTTARGRTCRGKSRQGRT